MMRFYKMAAMLLMSAVTVVVTTPAYATKAQRPHQVLDVASIPAYPTGQSGAATTYRMTRTDANGTIVGGRPSGCPYKYCGCSASLYVFGEIRPELNLAANWKHKFQHTAPSSGMVAARNGHVMVLMSHASGDEWKVHDGNSGGGKTREHVRSIAGYTIVDPRQPRQELARTHHRARHAKVKRARYARL